MANRASQLVRIASILLVAAGLNYGSDCNPPTYTSILTPGSGPASADPPYTILALGDSVVWGNGLFPEHRTLILTGQRIADITSRRVQLVSFAHSGASLAKQTEAPSSLPGPLNAQRPSISEQESCAVTGSPYASPDLILLDGCINEVGALHVAGLGGSPKEVHDDSVTYCGQPMLDLLTAVKRDFPKATTVVMSYFRVVSDKSNPFGGSGLSKLFDGLKSRKTGEALDRLNPEAASRRVRSNVQQTPPSTKEGLLAWWNNSSEFYDTSHACFRWAIASVDGGLAASPGAKVCAGPDQNPEAKRGDQFLMSVVPDDPTFAYGAIHAHIWSLRLKFLWWVWRKDEFYNDRLKLCKQYYKDDPIGEDGCEINPIAHPNVLGDRAYYKSVSCLVGTAWGIEGLCDPSH